MKKCCFLLLIGLAAMLQPNYSKQRVTSDAPPPAYTHTSPPPSVVTVESETHFGFSVPIRRGCSQPTTRQQEKALSQNGPQFPQLFNMSSLSVVGFVQGGWPMVLDYELREPGIYLVTISVEGQDPFDYLLDGSRLGHQQQIFALPARLGPKPVIATCTLNALSNVPGEVRPKYVRVFGWGCGPRAVGSVAIDQVRFTPPSVHIREKQGAVYGFHSHADFEKVSAEFELVGLKDGNIVAKLEDQQKIDEPVRVNTEISDKRWDARKASVGQHLLQIRAWYSVNRGGDWVIAWSPGIVSVEQ